MTLSRLLASGLTLGAALLTGCATVDRPQMSRFEPLTDTTFRFSARTDLLIYREDAPEAEAERMRWLQTYLADNKLCTAGYAIDSRRAVVIGDTLGKLYEIIYFGRCK